jgi:hypothetical protein
MNTEKRTEQLRKTRSYELWKDWIAFLGMRGVSQTNMQETINKLFNELDGRHSFGSERNANVAGEAIAQALQDFYNN